eukprot:1157326-Pelagomonas_calceolata.AAC.1
MQPTGDVGHAGHSMNQELHRHNPAPKRSVPFHWIPMFHKQCGHAGHSMSQELHRHNPELKKERAWSRQCKLNGMIETRMAMQAEWHD